MRDPEIRQSHKICFASNWLIELNGAEETLTRGMLCIFVLNIAKAELNK